MLQPQEKHFHPLEKYFYPQEKIFHARRKKLYPWGHTPRKLANAKPTGFSILLNGEVIQELSKTGKVLPKFLNFTC